MPPPVPLSRASNRPFLTHGSVAIGNRMSRPSGREFELGAYACGLERRLPSGCRPEVTVSLFATTRRGPVREGHRAQGLLDTNCGAPVHITGARQPMSMATAAEDIRFDP